MDERLRLRREETLTEEAALEFQALGEREPGRRLDRLDGLERGLELRRLLADPLPQRCQGGGGLRGIAPLGPEIASPTRRSAAGDDLARELDRSRLQMPIEDPVQDAAAECFVRPDRI